MAATRSPSRCLRDDVARVFVVCAILDDELHLVVRPKPIEVAPVVAVRLAAARAFHVEDRHDRSGTFAVLRWPPVSSSTVRPRSSSDCISG